jgi:hypothetical protein
MKERISEKMNSGIYDWSFNQNVKDPNQFHHNQFSSSNCRSSTDPKTKIYYIKLDSYKIFSAISKSGSSLPQITRM